MDEKKNEALLGQAMELRQIGASYRTIADELKITLREAYALVATAKPWRRAIPDEAAEREVARKLPHGAEYLAWRREATRRMAVAWRDAPEPPAEPDAGTRLRMASQLRTAIGLCEDAITYLLGPIDQEAYILGPPTERPGDEVKSVPVSAINPAQ